MDIKQIDGVLLAKMFKQAAYTLNQNKALVDSLNVFPVPDGDTGTNMSLTMNAAITELEKTPSAHAGNVAKAMSKGSLMGARGNSGVILSQIFRGFSKGCQEKAELTFVIAEHGRAHSWPILAASEQQHLKGSPWIVTLAILQEADAKSCLLPGGTHLPVFWRELVD